MAVIHTHAASEQDGELRGKHHDYKGKKNHGPARLGGMAEHEVRRKHNDAQRHQFMNIGEAPLPTVMHAEHVTDDQAEQKGVPYKVGVENLEQGLAVDRADHGVQIMKQVFQREGIGHPGQIVAEYGNEKHGQKAGQYLLKAVTTAQEGTTPILIDVRGLTHWVFLLRVRGFRLPAPVHDRSGQFRADFL